MDEDEHVSLVGDYGSSLSLSVSALRFHSKRTSLFCCDFSFGAHISGTDAEGTDGRLARSIAVSARSLAGGLVGALLTPGERIDQSIGNHTNFRDCSNFPAIPFRFLSVSFICHALSCSLFVFFHKSE